MARVQAQYDGRAEALQTVVAPRINAVQARLDPRASKGFQLAEALGAAEQDINALKTQLDNTTRREAQAFASSLTVEDLNKAIKDEKLLPSQSPLFVATVQNIAGQNQMKAVERDVLSRIDSGELSFADNKALDEYLVQQRNERLAGASSYTVAGFDQTWNNTRTRILDAHAKFRDKKDQEEALVVVSEKFQNRLAEVTAPGFQGSDADRVSAILSDYEAFTKSQILRGDNRKEALSGLALRLARSGNLALTRQLLNTKLPNNGPMIGAYIGDRTAVSIENIAQSEFDQIQRKNEAQTKAALDTAVLTGASTAADTAIAQNRGGEITDVTLPSGKTIKADDIAAEAIQRRIAATPDMPFAEQVRLYANNGVKNAGWEREFKTAVTSIGEVGMDAQGKPVGQLLPATVDILDRFAMVRQVSEQYAEKLAGGEENYKILRRIQALRELGTSGDASQAAAIVNRITRNQIPSATWGNIQQKVTTVMEDLTSPSIFSGRYWGEVFRGEWGNGEKNLLPIRATVKDLAETLLAAGIANSADEAVTMVGDYLSNPAVVTQINNTLYLNKDLPRVPAGEEGNTGSWVSAYMSEVVGERLKARGLPFDMKDLTLLPNPGGQGSFMVSLRAQPIPNENNQGFVTVTRLEIEQWIRSEYDRKRDITVDQRSQNKWYQMGPKNTFLTPERLQQSSEAYRRGWGN